MGVDVPVARIIFDTDKQSYEYVFCQLSFGREFGSEPVFSHGGTPRFQIRPLTALHNLLYSAQDEYKELPIGSPPRRVYRLEVKNVNKNRVEVPLANPIQLNYTTSSLKMSHEEDTFEGKHGIGTIDPYMSFSLQPYTSENACFEQVRPDFVVKKGQKVGMEI